MKQFKSGRGGYREGARRPKLKERKIRITVSVAQETKDFLRELGPSMGLAIMKTVEFWKKNKP